GCFLGQIVPTASGVRCLNGDDRATDSGHAPQGRDPVTAPVLIWHHGGMRVHNFGAGPCALPLEVLEEVRSEFPEYRDTGMTVIEMSHRSADYDEIHQGAKDLARRVAGTPDEFEIL